MKTKKLTADAAIVLSLMFIFFFAGVSRLINLSALRHDTFNQPLPDALKNILLWFIPSSEFAVVILLGFEKTRRSGLFFCLFVTILFSIYSILVVCHVLEFVPCSCNGIIRSFTWPQQIALNISLSVLTITAIAFDSKTTGLRRLQ